MRTALRAIAWEAGSFAAIVAAAAAFVFVGHYVQKAPVPMPDNKGGGQ